MKRIDRLPNSARAFWESVAAKMTAKGRTWKELQYDAHPINRAREAKLWQWCLREKQRGARRVLEVGCAQGDFTAKLVERFDDVWAIDFCRPFAKQTKQRVPQATVRSVNVETWHPLVEWDLIVASEVLEHLKDPVRVLEKWVPWASRLIVTMPICEKEPNPRAFDASLFMEAERIADASGHIWYPDGLDDATHLIKRGGWNVIEAVQVGRSALILAEPLCE